MGDEDAPDIGDALFAGGGQCIKRRVGCVGRVVEIARLMNGRESFQVQDDRTEVASRHGTESPDGANRIGG